MRRDLRVEAARGWRSKCHSGLPPSCLTRPTRPYSRRHRQRGDNRRALRRILADDARARAREVDEMPIPPGLRRGVVPRVARAVAIDHLQQRLDVLRAPGRILLEAGEYERVDLT